MDTEHITPHKLYVARLGAHVVHVLALRQMASGRWRVHNYRSRQESTVSASCFLRPLAVDEDVVVGRS